MSRPRTAAIEPLARPAPTGSRPTRRNRTARWRGTRRPLVVVEVSGRRRRAASATPTPTAAAATSSPASCAGSCAGRDAWTSGGAGERHGAGDPQPRPARASRSMRRRRRRRRALGPEGAAARLPLVDLLGRGARRRPGLRQRRLHLATPTGALREQLGGWVERGHARGEDEGRPRAGARPGRVRVAREAIGRDVELFVDANGAYDRKQALALAAPFRRARRRPGSRSRSPRTTWRAAPAPRPRAGRASRSPPASTATTAATSGACWRPARSTCCRPTPPAAAASPASCEAAALCRSAIDVPLSAHCAPALHVHLGCARLPVRHLEYFHDHVRIERMLFDGAPGRRRRAAARPRRPGLGLELKRADAERTQLSERVRARTIEHATAALPSAEATATTLGAPDRAASSGDARRAGRRAGRRRRAARSASTPAAGRSTRTDASNYRQLPIGVVVPRDARRRRRDGRDLPRATARRSLSRGGGTSLAGQCCNVAVVLDFSKYLNRILEIDPERRLARVEPGAVLDDLRDAAEEHGLTFGPDPATHNHCTLGGMIGNNSCGVHSVMAGRTADNVERAGGPDLRRRCACGRRDLRRRARAIIRAAGGRRARSTARCADLRDRYADGDPRALSRTSRAGSPATTSTSCCPRRLQRRARPGRQRGHLRHHPRGRRCAWSRARPSTSCWSSATPTSTRPPTHVPGDHGARPDRPRGPRRQADRLHERARACTRRRATCCPRAAAGCWSSSAARRGRGGRPRAERTDGRGCAARGRRPA